jgi:hypothetical protein
MKKFYNIYATDSFTGWLEYVNTYGRFGVKIQLRLELLKYIIYAYSTLNHLNKIIKTNTHGR